MDASCDIPSLRQKPGAPQGNETEQLMRGSNAPALNSEFSEGEVKLRRQHICHHVAVQGCWGHPNPQSHTSVTAHCTQHLTNIFCHEQRS